MVRCKHKITVGNGLGAGGMDAAVNNSSGLEAESQDRNLGVCDKNFCVYLERLRRLVYFLAQEGIAQHGSASVGLGELNALYFNGNGRLPTVNEWNAIENLLRSSFLLLSPEQKKRFLMAEAPWMLSWLPVSVLASFIPTNWSGSRRDQDGFGVDVEQGVVVYHRWGGGDRRTTRALHYFAEFFGPEL